MLDEIRVKTYEVEPTIRMRGYDYMPVEPREFLDYMTGPTPVGDKITLRGFLDSRFLMVHELVEMSELKKRGIPLHRKTVTDFHPIVNEAHMMAFDFELSLARDDGDHAWVDKRVKLIDSWLEDETLPSYLVQVCVRLKEKFTRKRVEERSELFPVGWGNWDSLP